MKTAYSYIRMSTSEQAHGDSARRQLALTEAYVLEHGLVLADTISDIGVSAYRGQNSEFGALHTFLEGVRTGAIENDSFLIIESLDRISRQNIFDAMALLNKIVAFGITIVTLQDRQTYSKETVQGNSASLMIAVITLLRSHDESKMKSDRLAAVWANKKKEARSGKFVTRRMPLWLVFCTKTQTIQAIPKRTDLLNEIFLLSKSGWGAHSICRKLNNRNEQSWSGKGNIWQLSYVKKLLHNRSVLGEYQPYKKVLVDGKLMRIPDGEPIKDYYPKVIDDYLFQEVSASISARGSSGRGRKGKSYSNLFTGMLKCGTCDSSLRYMNKGMPPKGGNYLQCSKALQGGKCSNKRIWKYEIIQDVLLGAIKNLDFEFILGGERLDSQKIQIKKALASSKDRLKTISTQIDNLVDAIAVSQVHLEPLVAKLRDLTDKKTHIETEISSLEQEQNELMSRDHVEVQKNMISLVDKIKKSRQDDQGEVLRRTFASELARVIKVIKIYPHLMIKHEIQMEEPDWYINGKISESDLDEICQKYSFRAAVIYQNGDKQAVQSFPLAVLNFDTSESAKQFAARRKNDIGHIN